MTTATEHLDHRPAALSLPRWGVVRATLLQHRSALIWVVVLFAGCGVLMLIGGITAHSGFDSLGLGRCTDFTSGPCQDLAGTFEKDYSEWNAALPFLAALPALVGGFVGAPLLAREFESGTFRFAWTQGCGRMRWLVTKLIVLGVILTAIALLLSWLVTWAREPFLTIGGPWHSGLDFEVIGYVFAARMLLAFALGAFAGAVIRRTVGAVAATLAAWIAVVVPTAVYLRPHYQAPITQPQSYSTSHGGANAWVLNSWLVGPNGQSFSQSQDAAPRRQIMFSGGDIRSWLATHGYQAWASYQPADRFWPFQWIEAGGTAALGIVLVLATIWWVRHRTA